ncbi:MAG: SDR family NAD(P)-dependent oxidoreductase [Gammaproteobacteria bacterium]|nr:SDR family NAD(P)-dependent oxidoreductase [Gammaproteobacteria bacterium]
MSETPVAISIPASPQSIFLVGASGGIGHAMLAELVDRFPGACIVATRFRSPAPMQHERVEWHSLDIRGPDAIAAWTAEFDRVDWVVNCAGFLHGPAGGPEKTIRSLQADFQLENVRVNTLPTLLLAKHLSSALKNSPAPVLATVSARPGSIEDNRLGGWYSYRVSKTALNMALKTLSIEWKQSHPRGCVAALHPGTNDTALSRPFQANLPPRNPFAPARTAEMFVTLLSELDPARSGNFWAWDGIPIPW